jgi:hypothetical protein
MKKQCLESPASYLYSEYRCASAIKSQIESATFYLGLSPR